MSPQVQCLGYHSSITSIIVISTSYIKQEQARIHFNCSNIMGVEIENQGGAGTASSHWEQRIFGVSSQTKLK